jgi:TetR/AcrR family transcriptional regulator, regulator of mycofactocin system
MVVLVLARAKTRVWVAYGELMQSAQADDERPGPGRPPGTSREVVARTALELFAERGFEETTIEDIAAAVGVGRRTLFRYFSSKADTVWGDFDWVLDRLRRGLRETSPDEPLMEALSRAVVESNRYEESSLPELRIRMQLITRVPALQAHSMLRYRAWREVIAEFVAERLGQPVDALGPQTLAHAALGTSMAAFVVWVDDPSRDLVETLEEAYALLASGFRL